MCLLLFFVGGQFQAGGDFFHDVIDSLMSHGFWGCKSYQVKKIGKVKETKTQFSKLSLGLAIYR